MDQIEDIDRDWTGDRLSERDVNIQRVSEAEAEKKVSAMLEGYDLGGSDRDDERSPPKLELVSEYRHPLYTTLLSPNNLLILLLLLQ